MLRRHVLVHFLRDWEHQAGALRGCACACLSKHAYMLSVTLIQSSKPSGTMQQDTVMKSTCCVLKQASPRGPVPTVLSA